MGVGLGFWVGWGCGDVILRVFFGSVSTISMLFVFVSLLFVCLVRIIVS